MEPTENHVPGEQATVLSDQPASSRKSYRRKYRKIMVTFEEKMREGNTLFKEEQRIMDISLRLAEQTDQLLQLLVELNSCPQVPQRLRYDLRPPGESHPGDETVKPTVSEEDAHLDLRKARRQLQAGEVTLAGYREIEAALLKTREFAPSRSYASLLSNAPTHSHALDKMDPSNVASCLLSTKQEEQYLQGLDAFLEGTVTNPRPHVANSLGSRSVDKTTERERETQLRNPVSVYNWLRKHQPQVFLQDNEPSTEKTPRATGSRSSTRRSANKDALKQEQDYYDEDGFALENGASLRGKRKRDADGGYRPKGGSSRSAKRRKETKEDSGRSKRTKKMSMDAR
ncbi:uncharacterized protein Z520_00996 [Fonsecaea multimorphosa CBS 102226]|uniref:Uncharacterized protein n=1 Tax=Fonsecaea multimorphosa CBS 102226 TaxID=1442371 RepID=A0A0D2HKW3_9EURO|nr:uncharacterized protein Z520_00996 [Fonsecaea multimorphosa CBS 102226]KIY02531.1 hypothetical protein Z520_00996 [Fonsecaea multimorphosa CBS 102226]OAL31398.1 hypothetical protein AYO22_00990 [Fonsecaea multimorphosa]